MSRIKVSRRFMASHYGKILKILGNELTQTQKCYIMLYYKERLTMKEIAQRYGVTTPTVSRTIKRASARIYKVMDTINQMSA